MSIPLGWKWVVEEDSVDSLGGIMQATKTRRAQFQELASVTQALLSKWVCASWTIERVCGRRWLCPNMGRIVESGEGQEVCAERAEPQGGGRGCSMGLGDTKANGSWGMWDKFWDMARKSASGMMIGRERSLLRRFSQGFSTSALTGRGWLWIWDVGWTESGFGW